MDRVVIDTETCGFHGPIVLLQYSKLEEDEIHLHEVFREPIDLTLSLIDWIAENAVIGFNLVFDWFHICQLYTTLQVYKKRHPFSEYIDPERYAYCEPEGRDQYCLKPASACDIMLLARNTKYQSLMDRKQIVIRRIPADIVQTLVAELNERLPFKPIYFDKRKDKTRQVWQYKASEKAGYCDIYVKFAASSRLKALAKDALDLEDDPITLSAIAMPPRCYPLELGYAPYAMAVVKMREWKGKGKNKFVGEWKGSWPSVIDEHIGYWGFRESARQYASDDVRYTKELYKYFGSPEPGDDDSILTCMVGAVRWKGFALDLEKIKQLRDKAIDVSRKIPIAPKAVKRYIAPVLSAIEQSALVTTNKESLTELTKWKNYDDCMWCGGEGCELCPPHPASIRAQAVLDARRAKKEIELYDKLIIADRLHASFSVIGTLSSRMAGQDKLNAQGIKRTKEVRSAFSLAFPGMQLDAGDFDSFEVCIADAIYDEPKLRAELLSTVPCIFCHGSGKIDDPIVGEIVCKECKGKGSELKKIHAIFGTFIFPGQTYETIRKSAKTSNDMYTIAKSGLFTWLFAGTEHSFQRRLGIPFEQAKNGLEAFGRFFPNVGKKRAQTMIEYSPLHQPEGRGSEVIWREHKDRVATLLGFERRFDLEYATMRGLYLLAQNPPEKWKDLGGSVTRYEKQQSLAGATQSALYAAAFALQGQISRAAINTPIQGTGAQITKRVQVSVWKVQPCGYRPWRVIPMQVHDEILTALDPTYSDDVAKIVGETVEEMRGHVPLLSIGWKRGMKSWAS